MSRKPAAKKAAAKKRTTSRPVPYFVDRTHDHLAELKERIDDAWESGKLHYPEKYPKIAALKEEYKRAYREAHGIDIFDGIVEEAEKDDALMDRVEDLIARSPEHRALLKGGTRGARALELEQDPEVRAKVLAGLEPTEEP